MTKRTIVVMAACAAVGACGSKKQEPQAAAPAPVASKAPATAPAAAPAPAHRLGPVDLDAETLDLAALFPRDRVSREAAAESEGDMPPTPPQLIVHRAGLEGEAGDGAVFVSLDGKRAIRIEVFAPGIATADGVEVGTPVATLARIAPKATCGWGGAYRGVICTDEGGFTYQVGVAWDGGDDVEVGELGEGEVSGIIWDWTGRGPEVAAGAGALALPGACKPIPDGFDGDDSIDLDGDGIGDLLVMSEDCDRYSCPRTLYVLRGDCGHVVGKLEFYDSATIQARSTRSHGLVDLAVAQVDPEAGDTEKRLFRFDGKKYREKK